MLSTLLHKCLFKLTLLRSSKGTLGTRSIFFKIKPLVTCMLTHLFRQVDTSMFKARFNGTTDFLRIKFETTFCRWHADFKRGHTCTNGRVGEMK